MTRSIPMDKAWDDAMVAYAQNGEAVRPEQGYPARLFLPGWEGNANVKWLRRLELADRPFMTREEASKYTDTLPDGTARQFSFVFDARSIITSAGLPRVDPTLTGSRFEASPGPDAVESRESRSAPIVGKAGRRRGFRHRYCRRRTCDFDIFGSGMARRRRS